MNNPARIQNLVVLLVCLFLFFFSVLPLLPKTGSLSVALAALEHLVDQAGLELTDLCLLLPPVKGVAHHHLAHQCSSLLSPILPKTFERLEQESVTFTVDKAKTPRSKMPLITFAAFLKLV